MTSLYKSPTYGNKQEFAGDCGGIAAELWGGEEKKYVTNKSCLCMKIKSLQKMKVVWLLEALRGRNNKVDLSMVLTVDSVLHTVWAVISIFKFRSPELLHLQLHSHSKVVPSIYTTSSQLQKSVFSILTSRSTNRWPSSKPASVKAFLWNSI